MGFVIFISPLKYFFLIDFILLLLPDLLTCMIHCAQNLFTKQMSIFYVNLLIYLKLKFWENNIADGASH